MIVFGGCLALLAAKRFHAVNRAIERGSVDADRGLVRLLVAVLVLLALVD